MSPAVRFSSRESGRVVAVTGADEPVGAVVCRELLAADGVREVIALGQVRPPVPGVTWRRARVDDPGLVQELSDVDALVHLAVDTDPTAERAVRREANSLAASVALTAAAAAGVRQVVMLSSAQVYGAQADNPVPLDDDAPLLATGDALVGDYLEVEQVAAVSKRAYPQTAVCVLRPAQLLVPGEASVGGGLLDGPRLLVVRGARPHWQFCHLDDLASAVVTCVEQKLSGPVTVGSEGWLEQAEVQRVLRRRPLELPASVAFGTAARLHAVGVSASPAELSYLVHPWVIGAWRLREAGWKPVYTNSAALQDFAKNRPAMPYLLPVDPKGATAAAGAAGATVAIIGTAALVRRARRKRRRSGGTST